MRVYHRTDAARQILAEGFRDTEGTYGTRQMWRGVWVSDRPLDVYEGADGESVLTLEIPADVFAEFEWPEDGKPYREALIPAHRLNQCGKPTIAGPPA